MINKGWQAARQYFFKAKPKEQALLLTALVLVGCLLWYSVIWSPLQSACGVAKTKLKLDQTVIKTLQAEQLVAEAKLNHDPNEDLSQKKQALLAQIGQLKIQIQQAETQLIDAPTLLQTLKTLSSKEMGIEMQSIQSLPLADSTESAAQQSLKQNEIELQFVGDFYATFNYLKKIEAMPYRLFWDQLRYTVTTYPKATVTLKLHSLSTGHDTV